MVRARVNGVALHYELQGDGPPLVLLHGLQGDSSTFGELRAALATRFTVLAFDQRGSGASEKPDLPLSTADLADDTAALMQRLGLGRAAVFGTSMGGQVAQQLAIRHPERVGRLILGCTTPGGDDAVPINQAAMDYAYTTEALSAEERAHRLAEVTLRQQWLAEHPEALDFLVAARRHRPLGLRALAQRRAAFTEHDTYAALAGIEQPTLVITGSPDALIPEDNSYLLARRLPNATLRVLEPAGHLFWIERPEDTFDAVTAFLASV